MTAAELTQHFYQKIPISRDMGLVVTEVSARHAVVQVPLTPNHNHIGTAFGGSLYAAAALACYALFRKFSQDEAGGLSDELVIQRGEIEYLAPVTTDFRIEAGFGDGEDGRKFLETLRRAGKARMKLTARVFCEGRECARFHGVYVYKSS